MPSDRKSAAAYVDEQLHQAASQHPWIMLGAYDRPVDLSAVDQGAIVRGLFSTVAALVDCTKHLATEIDRMNETLG